MAKKTKKAAKANKTKKKNPVIEKKSIKDSFREVLTDSFTLTSALEKVISNQETEARKQKFIDENKEAWRIQRSELTENSPPIIRPKEKIFIDLNEEKLNKILSNIPTILANENLSKYSKISEILRIIESNQKLCEEIRTEE